MMNTIKVIEEQARAIIEPLQAVKVSMEGKLAEANEALERAGVSGRLYGTGASLQLDKIIREFRADFTEAALRVFAQEIGVGSSLIEEQDGVAALVSKARETLDLAAFVQGLRELVNGDEAHRREQARAANRLACYFNNGIEFKRDELCFSVWATTDDYSGHYSYHVHGSFREMVHAINCFLKWRGGSVFNRYTEVDVALFNNKIRSRDRITLFRAADDSGRVDIITFKSKIEFRITGEMGRDFVAWLKKFADPARLAA